MASRILATLLTLFLLLSGCGAVSVEPDFTVAPTVTIATAATVLPTNISEPSASPKTDSDYDVTIELPADRFPETYSHIASAIENGASAVCTIDRDGADENRDKSLDGIPTKVGYDRDEWPMAMCAEGGDGADIAYVTPSDNRGAGSWVGNKLEDLADGTRVLFVVAPTETIVETDNPETAKPSAAEKPAATAKPTAAPTKTPQPTEEPIVVKENVYYANCAAVRDAGADPIYEGDPGYSNKLDRDGDGVACE